MRKLMVLILSILLPLNSFATECSSPVSLLQEGSPAPCKGYLFSPSKELDVRIMNENFNLLQKEDANKDNIISDLSKENDGYKSILQEEQQATELWKSRAVDITTKYVDVESSRQSRDLLFAGLGVLGTILIMWGIGQVEQHR